MPRLQNKKTEVVTQDFLFLSFLVSILIKLLDELY